MGTNWAVQLVNILWAGEMDLHGSLFYCTFTVIHMQIV